MSFFVLIHDLASLGETADDDDRNNGLTLNGISQPPPSLPPCLAVATAATPQ